MKPILLSLSLVLSLALPACVTDAQGHRHYAGPTISGSLGFNGVSLGLTLVGDSALPPVALPAKAAPDPKQIKPLSLNGRVLDERTSLGVASLVPFRLDVAADRPEQLVTHPDSDLAIINTAGKP
jgi:hypothetical protein